MTKMNVWIAAIIATFALVFTGCPQDTNEEGDGSPVVVGIVVSTYPTLLGYQIDVPAELSTAGIVVHRELSNGNRGAPVPVAELTFSALDVTTEGPQEITVTWNQFTTTFTVHIGNVPDRVELVTGPTKLLYSRGEPVDLTGVVMKAFFDDPPSEKEVTIADGLTYAVNITMNSAGPKILTIRYMGVGVDIPNNRSGIVVFGSEELRALAQTIADSEANPVPVRIPPTVTLAHLSMDYGGTQGVDALGGLYITLGGVKNIDLDLSDISWTRDDIDGTYIPHSNPDAFSWRNNSARWPNRIVNIRFPRNLVEINANAFRASPLSSLDLSGLNRLVAIGDSAFAATTAMQTVDFSGCTSLREILRSAFGQSGIRMLDLTETALTRIGDNAFQSSSLEFIEFPARTFMLADYALDNLRNLRYVRYRTAIPSQTIGWRNHHAVAQGHSSALKPQVHRIYGMSEQYETASMHNWLWFVPRNITWTVNYGAQYVFGGTRDASQVHMVTLPWTGSLTGPSFDAHLDGLRGQDLLDYDCGFRGQSSITIDTSNVQSRYAGHEVRTSWGQIFPIGSNITIGTPPSSALKEANPVNVQEITGLRANGNLVNHPDRPVPWAAAGTSPNWPPVNGRTGTYGMPVIWPDNLATEAQGGPFPNFVMLEMEVLNPQGAKVGYLDGWAKGSFDQGANDWYRLNETVRVLRWVYVDKPTTIFRIAVSPSPGRYTWLELKTGWNLLEVTEPYEYRHEDEAITLTPAGRNRLAFNDMAIWHSSGLIMDNSNGRHRVKNPDNVRDDVNNNIPARPIPWVVRSTNTWYQIINPYLTTDISVDPPVLITDVNAERPGLPIGTPADVTGWQDWMVMSRQHPWRMEEN